jgi:hypothetical protein
MEAAQGQLKISSWSYVKKVYEVDIDGKQTTSRCIQWFIDKHYILPTPDLIYFFLTGRERPATFQFICRGHLYGPSVQSSKDHHHHGLPRQEA